MTDQMEVINQNGHIGLFKIEWRSQSSYVMTVTSGLGMELVVPITKSEAERMLINLDTFMRATANALNAARTAIALVMEGAVTIALQKRNGALLIEFSESFIVERHGPALFVLPSETAFKNAVIQAILGWPNTHA